MMNKKLFYGILIVVVAIVGVSLFIYLDKLIILSPTIPVPTPEPVETKLSYNVGGCGEKEEREYIKTKNLKEKVDARVDNGFIKLTHYLSYVCCAQMKVYLDSLETYLDYTLIKIKEKNEGEMCKCICDYEIDAQIGPLKDGKYLIQIWGIEFAEQPINLLWEKEILITEKETKLPNPASVYCREQGGKQEIRKDKDGNEWGFCIFPDGSECGEWKFFRGECKKGERFCKDLCGDGICQEVVCQAIGCPCAETSETCLQDCPKMQIL